MRSLRIFHNTNWLEDTNCPICGSDDIKQYEQVASAPYIIAKLEGYEFLMGVMSNYFCCKNCLVIFQNPHMKEEDITRYYESGLYRGSLGLSVEMVMKDEMARSESVTEFLLASGIKPETHLDIGASNGCLINELNEKLGTVGSGYDLYGKYGENYGAIKFDLVTSLHTLEHCFDPIAELERYRKLCGKWLLLEVPRQSEYLDVRGLRFSHLFSFPRRVVENMVKEAGFKILMSVQDPDTRILAEVC